LDQLEGRHCKDTQKCWPFYIGAPKGPFLQGLTTQSHDFKKTQGIENHIVGLKKRFWVPYEHPEMVPLWI
jgi:hypothetical protein